jgi:hypothetical protein
MSVLEDGEIKGLMGEKDKKEVQMTVKRFGITVNEIKNNVSKLSDKKNIGFVKPIETNCDRVNDCKFE